MDSVFLARQPLVNRAQQVVGYELLYRGAAVDEYANFSDASAATAQVLVNSLTHTGAQWLLADKLAFLNVTPEGITDEWLGLLPAPKVVLELRPAAAPDADTAERLRQARALGFRVALDGFTAAPAAAAWLPFADYVKVDIQALGPVNAGKIVRALANHRVKPIALKVESRAEFRQCLEVGFETLQGYYFARPQTFTARMIQPAHQRVLQLLGLVRKEAPVKDIEAAFKGDVALTFKLLRYINSVGFGLSCEIQSIRHAVTILGYQQLYRWLTLLLVTADNKDTPPALVKTAVTRGRLCELLGAHHLDRADQDNLFIAGVFSLLDVMLETPMAQVLDKLTLPEAVADALLARSGLYGPILALTEACEQPDPAAGRELAELLQLSAAQINEAHIAALAWVESLGV